MSSKDSEFIGSWRKRYGLAEDVKKTWEKRFRVVESYQWWTGNQRADEFDEKGERKVQLNLIHTSLRAQLPSLLFYRPFAKVTAAPEQSDSPGSTVDDKAQLLQDTGNYLVREPSTGFMENTFLALKESMWAIGCVEVGYSATFVENPEKKRPPIKESEWTKVEPPAKEEPVLDEDGLTVSPQSDLPSLEAELARLRGELSSESFYVKHIPAKQLLISGSDKAIIGLNDWIGYWEEYPLEDVKRAPAYENTKDLKASGSDSSTMKRSDAAPDHPGGVVKLYKIWDLRSKTRFVIAEGHDRYLLKKPYKRLPLKVLRFNVDPVHFWPIPPIFNWLPPQEEYNDSREYLRKVRKGTVPMYTVDDDAVTDAEMQKLDGGTAGTYVRRKSNTSDPIQPINQPTYAQNALTTLSISEKEFNSIAGVPAEFRQTQEEKTATQAVIQSNQAQVQDSFDRDLVAKWLASVIEELIFLAVENLNIERWITINIDPDSPFAMQEAEAVASLYQKINAKMLQDASEGISWHVQVDVESLSPVSEEQKFNRWMQTLTMILNPGMMKVFALSPSLLKRTLDLAGLRSGKEQDAIREALQGVMQFDQAMAAAQAGGGSPPSAPGVASQPSAPAQRPLPPSPGTQSVQPSIGGK